jgi:hypothetical protein
VISYEHYRILHELGVIVLFSSLGGAAVLALSGAAGPGTTTRRMLSGLHLLALLLVLVAGFGLASRLDLVAGGLPPWIWGKLAIWLVAAGLPSLLYRKPGSARGVLLLGVPFLAAAAAWLAVFKPGN